MILVLNCGSSSLKYAIFSHTLKLLKQGNFENITDHKKTLTDLLKTIEKPSIIAHRIVHGGELFTKTTLITKENIDQLESLNSLAPLHNPIQVETIKYCQTLFPTAKNIAVFDTAFFHMLTPEQYRYALPSERYQKFHIRKYGFHGISHQYLWDKVKTH